MIRAVYCFAVLNCVLSFPKQPAPCRLDDHKCITSLAEEAYTAAFKVSEVQLDPMYQEKIVATLPNLTFTLRDTTIKGFKSCQVKNASMSSDKTSAHMEMLCPRFVMHGHYDADGTIEKVPFQGNGAYFLDARDYDVILKMKLKSTVKDGKKYVKINDYDVDGQLKGSLDFELENLFKGNKELSAAANLFIKENPEFVTQLLQKPIFMANVKKLVEASNRNLNNTPVDGLIE